MSLLYLTLLCQCCLTWYFGMASLSLDSDDEHFKVLMPNISLEGDEQYKCATFEVPNGSYYITGVKPHPQEFSHHIGLFGCEVPLSKENIWNCDSRTPKCESGQAFIFGWGEFNDGQLEPSIPSGMGMRIGKGTNIKYLVLSNHYRDLEGQEAQDSSGIILKYTSRTLPMNIGIFYMSTLGNGKLEPEATGHSETACEIQTDGVIHPFYLSTHTHSLGKVASAWKVDKNNTWTLIGKSDPIVQHLIALSDASLTLTNGDTLATRCTFENNGTVPVSVGGMEVDEMCTIYLGYWVIGNTTVTPKECKKPGPGLWSWANNTNLKNIPDEEADVAV